VPEQGEPWPSRAEAVETAFALFAGGHERVVSDIAEAFAKKGQSSGK
jgi:hypothetical protein